MPPTALVTVTMDKFKHLQTDIDPQRIFWLGLDVQDKKINLLNAEVFTELEQVCGQLRTLDVQGLVLYSAKPGSFIAGADLKMLYDRDQQPMLNYLQQGQRVLQAFEELPFPTLALIEGHCLGAGLELALAMNYRIAADTPNTCFGLPEVNLGLHPAFGGIARTAAKAGVLAAMEFMLSGRSLQPAEALQKKLIDALIDTQTSPEPLRNTAVNYLQQRPAPKHAPVSRHLLSNPAARILLSRQLRRQLEQKNIDAAQYPAPYALITLWQKHGSNHCSMRPDETQSVLKLSHTETANNLIRLFFQANRIKAQAKPELFHPQRVHVMGAGIMGRDIAAWCAARGMQVSLQDNDPAALEQALEHAQRFFGQACEQDKAQQEVMQSRLCTDAAGIKTADVVIDATSDKLADKQELLAAIEELARPDALITTTTSLLPLERLASVMLRPERLIGLHFLNPAVSLQLVEVIQVPDTTDPRLLAQAMAFLRHIDKLPLPVRNTPGYLINRILFRYILQGIRLYQQDVPPAVIDKAGRDFGIPLGPLEMADQFGLDFCRQMSEQLAKASTTLTVPERLIEMVNAGKLGEKNGSGFYRYRNGRTLKLERVRWDGNLAALQDKLIGQMLEEAAMCLEDGVIEDPDLLDAAVVFGIGFAPFRGGPLRYAQLLRK